MEVILAELELAAQTAFARVEQEMEHFYEMRNQAIVGDVTQAVIRVSEERGLPNRTAMELARRVPEMLDSEALGHEVNMFDLTNLITNQANDPALRTRRGSRLQLERAGGELVRIEAARCGHCYQVLR
jgi:hypothetical protein